MIKLIPLDFNLVDSKGYFYSLIYKLIFIEAIPLTILLYNIAKECYIVKQDRYIKR